MAATAFPLGYPDRLLAPGQTYDSVTETISSIVLHPQTTRSPGCSVCDRVRVLLMFFFAVTYLLLRGVGIWGINIPVAWGFAIVNFVWWIGIGHAGTFISAILLLLHAKMAHGHQPPDRGDDFIRGDVRRHVSAVAPGAALGFLLAASVSRHDEFVAAISQPAGVGCVCREHLFHRVADFLVHRA